VKPKATLSIPQPCRITIQGANPFKDHKEVADIAYGED